MQAQAATSLRIEPLDAQIQAVLLDRILTGELAPAQNLNELQLAQELGISRTPVRQALIRLQQDGFVLSQPNRGFFVTPLTMLEAFELYPILSSLESLALCTTPVTKADIDLLRQLNAQLAATDPQAPADAVRKNLEWHQALLSGCPNGRLLSMIANLRQQIFRYELAFYSPGEERLRKSVQLHEGIMEALRDGDVAAASARLEAHWREDLDSIVPAKGEPSGASSVARAATTRRAARPLG